MRRAYSRNRAFKAPTRNKLIYFFVNGIKAESAQILFQNALNLSTTKRQENIYEEGKVYSVNQQQQIVIYQQAHIQKGCLALNQMDFQKCYPFDYQDEAKQLVMKQQGLQIQQTSYEPCCSQNQDMDIQQYCQSTHKSKQEGYQANKQLMESDKSYASFNSDQAIQMIQQVQNHQKNMNNSYISFNSDEAMSMIEKQMEYQSNSNKSISSFDSDQVAQNLSKFFGSDQLDSFHKIV